MKLQESKGRYFINMPKALITQKGWTKGKQLFAIFNERGNIEITDKM